MKQFETNLVQKSSTIFSCELCDYTTCRKSQYERHLVTDKHKSRTNETFETEMKQKGTESSMGYKCICGIYFNSRTTLWRHKKLCENINSNNKEKNICIKDLSDKDLIIMLINDNKELRNLLIEQVKEKDEYKTIMMEVLKNGTNNTTNTNTNCMNNNKTFNLQFFLNETCKDAMNAMDFVDSIKIQLSDIESIGELGYVNGMSKLIIKHLNALDENMRPIHCSDPKRDSLYVQGELAVFLSQLEYGVVL